MLHTLVRPGHSRYTVVSKIVYYSVTFCVYELLAKITKNLAICQVKMESICTATEGLSLSYSRSLRLYSM